MKFGKNNIFELKRRSGERFTRYSIRRIHGIVGSVAVASGIFLGAFGFTPVAYADTVEASTDVVTEQKQTPQDTENFFVNDLSVPQDVENPVQDFPSTEAIEQESAPESEEIPVEKTSVQKAEAVETEQEKPEAEAVSQVSDSIVEEKTAENTSSQEVEKLSDQSQKESTDAAVKENATTEDRDDQKQAEKEIDQKIDLDNQKESTTLDPEKLIANRLFGNVFAVSDRDPNYRVPDYAAPVEKVTNLKDTFDWYGDLKFRPYNYGQAHTEVLRFSNTALNTDQAESVYGNSALNFKNKISFENDFDMEFEITTDSQSASTNNDGFGFIFYEGDFNDIWNSNKGSILHKSGYPNIWGFRYDVGFNAGDNNDIIGKQNRAGYPGYGSFAKNDASGTTTLVGKLQRFNYATNALTGFRGQNLNPLTIHYDAKTKEMTLTYAGLTWKENVTNLTPDLKKSYGFAIMSSKEIKRQSNSASSVRQANANGAPFISYTPDELKSKAEVRYIDDDMDKHIIATDSTEGKVNEVRHYNLADKIAAYEAKGYEYVSDDVPKEGIVLTKDPQIFEVHFKHGVRTATPEESVATRRVHYVGAPDEVLPKAVEQQVTFERTGTYDKVTGEFLEYSEWKAKDGDTFKAVVTPVVEGYYADKAQVSELQAHPGDKLEDIVTYKKLGSLVPQVPGLDPQPDPVPYPNDPKDPTKPGEPVIPDVPGYTPIDPDGNDLTPGDNYPIDKENPGKDTIVNYRVNAKASVVYYDDTTKTTLETVAVAEDGKVNDTVVYSPADKIAAYEAKGYEYVSDDVPKEGIVLTEKPQTFTVHFKHGVGTVTPDKPGEPGKPINPDNPEGPTFPAETGLKELTSVATRRVHYVGAPDEVLPKAVEQQVTFERTGTYDKVTGEFLEYSEWKAKDGDTFKAVVTPVVEGYYADKAQVSELQAHPGDKLEDIVTYKKLGSLVPQVPGLDPQPDPVPYPNDPKDPTKPGEPVIPDVPGYTPIDPDGNDLTPGDNYPIDKENPGKDTIVNYRVNAKASVVYYDDTTKTTLETVAVAEDGKVNDTVVYSPADKIAAYEAKGYEYVSDDVPKEGIVLTEKPQTFTVHFKHGVGTVTPDKPGEPGKPINPDNPEGPTFPAETGLKELTSVATRRVHYVGAPDEVLPKAVEQQVTFERTGTYDKVTGEFLEYSEWKAKDGDTFKAVVTPVVEGYYADKAQVSELQAHPGDKLEDIVTYKKLGSLVPQVPGLDPQPDPVPYPNDPKDPTKPGEPVIPDVPGYTPIDPDGNDLTPGDNYPIDKENPGKDTIVNYRVNAKASVVYYDDTTKTTLETVAVAEDGKVNDTVVYSPADKIAAYEAKGYEYVSDDVPKEGIVLTEKPQTFTVHFKHGVGTVTPDKPGEPGKPINPDNPEGPTFPAETGLKELTSVATRRVHYVGAPDEVLPKAVEQQVTFERTGTYDKVTGEFLEYSEWKAKDGDTFKAVVTPVVEGYYADKAQVSELQAHPGDKLEDIVTYKKLGSLVPQVPGLDPQPDPVPYPNDPKDPTKPGEPVIPDVPGYTPIDPDGNDLTPGDNYPIDKENPGKDTIVNYRVNAKASVVYYDDTTKTTLETVAVAEDGKVNDTVVYSPADKIAAYEAKGYEYVSDDVPKEGIVLTEKPQTFTVHFKHGVGTVTPDKPGEPGKPINPDNPEGPTFPAETGLKELTSVATRRVHYVGAPDEVLPKAVEQQVTFERTGTYDKVTGEFLEYSEWKAKDGDTFKAVVTPVVEGYYADKAQVSELQAHPGDKLEDIVTYKKLGSLVPQVPGLDPQPDPVPYPNDPKDPTKPGEPVIPDVPGYTPIDPDGNDLTPGDNYPIDKENPGKDTIVNYRVNAKASVVYYDDTTKTTLETVAVAEDGKVNDTVVYSPADKIAAYEAKGYEYVSDDVPKEGIVLTEKPQTFTVHFKHGVGTVTPDKPGEPGKPINPDNPEGPTFPAETGLKELTSVATRRVHYVGAPDEVLPKAVEQQVTFERTGTYDKVTGEFLEYSEWKAKDGDTFKAVVTPVVEGYYADKAQVSELQAHPGDKLEDIVTYKKLGSLVPQVPGLDPQPDPVPYPNDPKDPTKPGEPVIPDVPGYTPIDPDGNDLTPGDNYPIDKENPGKDTIVNYRVNAKASVVYYDDTTKTTLETVAVAEDGKVNDTVVYSPADKIAAYEAKGYEYVSDDVPKEGIVLTEKPQTFTVHFKHGVGTVTPDKPGEPGKPINPDNPEGPTFPAETGLKELTSVATRRVHYVGAPDEVLPKAVEQQVTFERTGTYDKVTGEFLEYSEWKAKDGDTFKAVVTPVVEGYYADKAQVSELQAHPGDKLEDIVTYKKLGSLVPQVPGLDPQPDPVPYPNDPKDPTKPGEPVIPDVPGYTPIDPDGNDLTPGDNYPIDKENPGKDTIVNYRVNAKASVVYYDDTTKTTLETVAVAEDGKVNDTVVYSPADKIAAYEAKGYEYVSDDVPKEGIVLTEKPQTFTVHFKHGVGTVTPDKPGEPGKPINPDNPEGPTFPAETGLKELTSVATRRVHYVGAPDEVLPKAVEQQVTFERTGTYDKVTGEFLEYSEWKAKDGDTFKAVVTPVVEGYYADKAQVSELQAHQGDKLEVTVTYHKLEKPVVPQHPSHPSKPAKPLLPDVPVVKPEEKPSKPEESAPIEKPKPEVNVPVEKPKPEEAEVVTPQENETVLPQKNEFYQKGTKRLPQTGFESPNGISAVLGALLTGVGMIFTTKKKRDSKD